MRTHIRIARLNVYGVPIEDPAISRILPTEPRLEPAILTRKMERDNLFKFEHNLFINRKPGETITPNK